MERETKPDDIIMRDEAIFLGWDYAKEQECIAKEREIEWEAREKRNAKWDGDADIYRAIRDLQKSRVSAHDLRKEHHLSGEQTTRITVSGGQGIFQGNL